MEDIWRCKDFRHLRPCDRQAIFYAWRHDPHALKKPITKARLQKMLAKAPNHTVSGYPVAHTNLMYANAATAKAPPYKMNDLNAHYQIPAVTTGTTPSVTIIELGGGFDPNEVATNFSNMGLAAQNPKINVVSVDGATNDTTTDQDANAEVMLDICGTGAVISQSTGKPANLNVIFAPNTIQGFVDAFLAAAKQQPPPAAISVSWGASENGWSAADRQKMDAAIQKCTDAGISIYVSAGDSGSSDGGTGLNVDYPASNPHVMAIGGTSVPSLGSLGKDGVWNDGTGPGGTKTGDGATGGGVSAVYAEPSYQKGIALYSKGRNVPDYSVLGDPDTGVALYVNGQNMQIGGTSYGAPFEAGRCALSVQKYGKRYGDAHSVLYLPFAKRTMFNDINDGRTNDFDGKNKGLYPTKKGDDAATGLGELKGLYPAPK
jgi:kumamolisin